MASGAAAMADASDLGRCAAPVSARGASRQDLVGLRQRGLAERLVRGFDDDQQIVGPRACGLGVSSPAAAMISRLAGVPMTTAASSHARQLQQRLGDQHQGDRVVVFGGFDAGQGRT